MGGEERPRALQEGPLREQRPGSLEVLGVGRVMRMGSGEGEGSDGGGLRGWLRTSELIPEASSFQTLFFFSISNPS